LDAGFFDPARDAGFAEPAREAGLAALDTGFDEDLVADVLETGFAAALEAGLEAGFAVEAGLALEAGLVYKSGDV